MATVERPANEVRAEARYVRTAPRKAQLVAEQIRGRTVPEARTILAFMARDAARDMEKVLNSAIANAEANHGLAGDDLYVSAAYVGAGPTLKRWRARARGRVARIRKRTCHITVKLASPQTEPAAPPAREESAATPRRAGRKPEVAETTVSVERAEDKPKTRPKRAEKPKAADAGDTTEESAKPARGRTPSSTARERKPATGAERSPRRKKSGDGEES